MAAPEHTEQENGHLRELMQAALPRYGSANQLAAKLEIAASSLGRFLGQRGGASKDTARRFAELEGITYEQAIGRANRGGSDRKTPTQPLSPAVASSEKRLYRATKRAVQKARVLLKVPPQNFSDAAIDIADEDTFFEDPEIADRPGAVAEAFRHTILGSWAEMPVKPPSSSPPAGIRRSRMRER